MNRPSGDQTGDQSTAESSIIAITCGLHGGVLYWRRHTTKSRPMPSTDIRAAASWHVFNTTASFARRQRRQLAGASAGAGEGPSRAPPWAIASSKGLTLSRSFSKK